MARRSRSRRHPLEALPAFVGLVLLLVFFGPPVLGQFLAIAGIVILGGGCVVLVGLVIRAIIKRRQSKESNWSAVPNVQTAQPVPLRPTPAVSTPVETHVAQDEPTWSLELLRELEWKRFEEVVANYFTRQGYLAETTRIGADGGVDVYLYRAPDLAPVAVVQCKAWNVYDVGVKPVRELFGVMAAAKVSEGYFVTTGSFTQEARHFGRDNEIVLIDGDDLLDRFTRLTSSDSADLLEFATSGDFTTPTCPQCGVKMVTRVRSKDQSTFWGCRHYPRCHRTFNVSTNGS